MNTSTLATLVVIFLLVVVGIFGYRTGLKHSKFRVQRWDLVAAWVLGLVALSALCWVVDAQVVYENNRHEGPAGQAVGWEHHLVVLPTVPTLVNRRTIDIAGDRRLKVNATTNLVAGMTLTYSCPPEHRELCREDTAIVDCAMASCMDWEDMPLWHKLLVSPPILFAFGLWFGWMVRKYRAARLRRPVGRLL